MPTAPRIHRPQIAATLRQRGEVTPLELFFDLVFVLAITQCTALMADEPTWQGLAKGLLVLGVLWWAWVGYSWLTSAVDPEEGAVRIVIFAAMAALLVIALCVPQAFYDLGLVFAGAYAVVRTAHIALFRLASVDDADLRASTNGLAVSTAIGVGLLIVASQLDGVEQGALWLLALLLDMAGPYFFGAEGWKLVPEHFAERHGLIIIIALGESIVAIGVGAEETLTFGISAAAVIGIALACSLWWAYFDVVALVARRRLVNAGPGREQNEIARDSYSYLHFPMVAGIVLLALGLKKTIGDVEEPLKIEVATAMLGGLGIFLLAHVAFRWRNVHRFSTQRLIAAIVLAALIPLAVEIAAIATLAIATAVMVAMIIYELWRFREFRDRLRHGLPIHPEPEPEPEPAAPAPARASWD
ncbi:MAG: low temperature requirement protein A [Solirubrobacterales bacterium]|nr:low temperature requirement protein A [Solirubrobacterales bacterium]